MITNKLRMMKKKKFEGVEFFLVPNEFNGYRIIEHAVSSPQGNGACCFNVTDYWISDGDGFPTQYDNTAVKVDETVYECAMCMFRAAVDELWKVTGEPIPADMEIKAGDHIYYGGYFFHIVSMSPNECLARSFYADGYDINVDIDIETLEDLDFTLEELKAEGQLITKEVYEEALAKAESVIQQTEQYLKIIFENKTYC